MTRIGRLGLALVIMLGLLFVSAAPLVPALAEAMQTYVVLYKKLAVPAEATSVIDGAGGVLLYSYDRIGVAIAQSDDAAFRDRLLKEKSIESVSSTAGFGVKLNDEVIEVDEEDLPAEQMVYDDPYFSRQWDMRQIHVPEAHLVTMGSPDVVVGDIDTGLDYTHPDLAANVDFSNSVSCVGGVPNQDPAAWMDEHGHGTHTAGTIAALANNGIGVIGVAPNVKIAGIKAGNDDGYFFPEAVICAFMWAGDHHLDVTNNSYYADPWLFNCRNDHEQHAIWKAEQRAIRYAMSQGVTVVAAQGNENMDLAKKNYDDTSPDYPPGSEIDRQITNACVQIPNEIPGVIGVTANGSLLQKSAYSSYGVGVTQVVAPGGDSRRYQDPGDGSRGAVYSTYPGNRYVGMTGTSMASPHVAGVAALILSEYGKMPPGRVQAIINQTAEPQPCPPNPFDPSGTGRYLAICQGGIGYNSFYGHGQVDAYNAVTR